MGKLLHISYSGKSYVYCPLSSRYNAQVELQPSAWDRFQENRADLLVLLTDSRYGTITGLADFYLPAAIVSVGYMGSPRYNFVHEIGHLLGVRHNRVSNMGNEPDDAGCNFGYRFQYFGSSVGYTVMARMTDPGAFRILNFSNPRIELLGSPIGASGSNNSGYLSKNFCSIATKYFDVDELEVDISGPSSIICGGSGTYTAVITPPTTGIPGLPPYTYLWGMGKLPFVSLGYPAGSTFLGNPPSVTIQSSSIDFDAYWLFLNIWSSDGVMTSDLIKFTNLPCSPAFSTSTSKEDFGTDAKLSLIISPNPTKEHLTINFGIPETYLIGNYNISNSLGQVVLTGTLLPEQKGLPINLPSGVYCLQISTSTGIKVKNLSFNANLQSHE